MKIPFVYSFENRKTCNNVRVYFPLQLLFETIITSIHHRVDIYRGTLDRRAEKGVSLHVKQHLWFSGSNQNWNVPINVSKT
jgi:hypothetical protein